MVKFSLVKGSMCKGDPEGVYSTENCNGMNTPMCQKGEVMQR